MALEDDLMAALLALCPRVYLGVAPNSTPLPYVTLQHTGGRSLRYFDNAPAARRNALVKVNTLATTPMAAHALMLQIEEALCAAAAFQATPRGEPVGAYGDADVAGNYLQTYSITGAR